MRTSKDPSPPRPLDTMADSMSYPATSHYMPAHTHYYSTPHVNHGHVHVVSPPPRQETSTQRKRPKYTRSKTGCLTCRVKKIKCDETKPNCMRCTHGQRDCTWPEGVPARKKSVSRKDSVDGRPSTAGSSISESSTPPTREHTPPRRPPTDLGLPLPLRRPVEPYLQLHPMSSSDQDPGRRQLSTHDRSPGYSHPSNPGVLSMIPEASYSTQPRYDHSYNTGPHPASASRHAMPGFRPMNHQPVNQWNPPPDSLDPYFPNIQERSLVTHSSNDTHNRYQ
ncbi:hypothetical protein BD779DRAFT_1505053 [Infundibulicybe gibba]|nr:hypothetical protein BD779DRAFT_1505053 [Infundibulicybe gibba]